MLQVYLIYHRNQSKMNASTKFGKIKLTKQQIQSFKTFYSVLFNCNYRK